MVRCLRFEDLKEREEEASLDFNETELDEVRQRLGHELGLEDVKKPRPGEVCVDLLEAWRELTADPDNEPAKWLEGFTPAGIEVRPELRRVFPPSDDPQVEIGDPEEMSSYENCAGVDDSEIVDAEVADLPRFS